MSTKIPALPNILILMGLLLFGTQITFAQTAPSKSVVASYDGLHAAAYNGDIDEIQRLISEKADLEKKDQAGRTALHVAAFASHEAVITALSEAGANMNALDHQAYDIVTIAAVANDLDVLKTALQSGSKATNITSPYDGTALIAAAHLGHHEVVKMLIDAGAPLDHVNNLHWTALIEAVVLGDGGFNHVQTIKHLVNAGADQDISDSQKQTPLMLSEAHGFTDIIAILRQP